MKDTRASSLLSAVSERKWQDTVVGICHARKYLVFHTHDSRRCTPGFPDLILIHPGKKRMVVAELKTVSGQIDEAQQIWLHGFSQVATRPQVYVWRPGELEEINNVLGAPQ